MPLIRIEYDSAELNKEAVKQLSEAVRNIVSEVTGIKDVFVYANVSQITVQIAPVEIFVEMTASKIEDKSILAEAIKTKLTKWKEVNGFAVPINLTLIPMDWVVEVGI